MQKSCRRKYEKCRDKDAYLQVYASPVAPDFITWNIQFPQSATRDAPGKQPPPVRACLIISVQIRGATLPLVKEMKTSPAFFTIERRRISCRYGGLFKARWHAQAKCHRCYYGVGQGRSGRECAGALTMRNWSPLDVCIRSRQTLGP